MRLLYLPNEASLDDISRQIGPRKAFQHLGDVGELEALRIYSFLHEANESGDPGKVRREILESAADFRPDILFWQHVDHFSVDDAFIADLRAAVPSCRLVYHEADPYARHIKRINENMKVLFRHADLVVMSGVGSFFSIAREAGARRLLYSRQHFDNVRSGRSWEPTLDRPNDLVMIANAVGSIKIPGRRFPGSRNRVELGRRLSRIFGERFCLHGNGWEGLSSDRGRLPFDRQEVTLRSAWLSVNWQHFDREPYYFSNRVPISMAAGVPHVTNYQPGYERIFKDCEGGLYFAETVGEAVELVEYLLSRPREFLIDEGRKAQAFAHAHLETNVVYADIVRKLKEIFPGDASPETSKPSSNQ